MNDRCSHEPSPTSPEVRLLGERVDYFIVDVARNLDGEAAQPPAVPLKERAAFELEKLKRNQRAQRIMTIGACACAGVLMVAQAAWAVRQDRNQ